MALPFIYCHSSVAILHLQCPLFQQLHSLCIKGAFHGMFRPACLKLTCLKLACFSCLHDKSKTCTSWYVPAISIKTTTQKQDGRRNCSICVHINDSLCLKTNKEEKKKTQELGASMDTEEEPTRSPSCTYAGVI